MVLAGVTFTDSILALHIAAVMIAFGVTFTYPLLIGFATRMEPASLPAFWRAVGRVDQRVVQPGLAVVLGAGIYLATDEHQWSHFYVGWGVAAVIVLGALGGAFFAPVIRRLAEAAERDLAAAAGGQVTPSTDYQRLLRRWTTGGIASALIVLATIYLMANHVG